MIACAPVAHFALAVADGRIVGHAAPAAGPLPCVVRLEADDEPIAIVRATRFSAEAAVAGIRRGWCGIEMGGLGLAVALADRARLVCVASDAVLVEIDLPPLAPPCGPPAMVEGLIADAHQGEICPDRAAIRPFVEATLRRHGITATLAAAYRTLLLRPAEPSILADWAALPPLDDPAGAMLDVLLTSAEYTGRPGRMIPGPFHPAFAFDLSPLDDPPA